MKRFPRPVWVIFLGVFINRFGTFVLPFLALRLSRLGYHPSQIALALGAYGAGHLVASILGGQLADHLGRRNTIVLSMFSGAVSMLCLSQAESLGPLVALSGLAGVTAEFYKPAASALLSDLVAARDRVTAYAAYRFAINAGWALGPATAGFLARYSYTWLFVGDAATSITFGLIAWKGLPATRPEQAASQPVCTVWAGLKAAADAARHDRRLQRLLLAAFTVALVFMQMPTTFGLQVKAVGLSESVYGLLLALNGVLIVLFELPLSTWTRRLPPRRVMAAGYVLIGCGLGVPSVADSPGALTLAMIVFTLGEMVSMPVAMAYVAKLAPDHMRGRYMGLHSLAWACAFTAGPSLGLTLFALSHSALWAACCSLGVLGAGIILLERRRLPVSAPATLPSPPEELTSARGGKPGHGAGGDRFLVKT